MGDTSVASIKDEVLDWFDGQEVDLSFGDCRHLMQLLDKLIETAKMEYHAEYEQQIEQGVSQMYHTVLERALSTAARNIEDAQTESSGVYDNDGAEVDDAESAGSAGQHEDAPQPDPS